MTMVAVALALAIPGGGAADYWHNRPNCERGYSNGQARHGLRRVLHNLRPLGPGDLARVRDWRVCSRTRAGRRGTERLARKLRAWRLRYPQVWAIRFYRLPSWQQGWAWSTGACESGNNPATATGNGFYGAFQFVPSTWWAAGGVGMPNQHPWHYQAVIAVRWMLRAGAGQWPVCGH